MNVVGAFRSINHAPTGPADHVTLVLIGESSRARYTPWGLGLKISVAGMDDGVSHCLHGIRPTELEASKCEIVDRFLFFALHYISLFLFLLFYHLFFSHVVGSKYSLLFNLDSTLVLLRIFIEISSHISLFEF